MNIVPQDSLPICPKCGCPAKECIMTAKVRCSLNPDGTPGRVVAAGKRLGGPTYVCGGGHEWELEPN